MRERERNTVRKKKIKKEIEGDEDFEREIKRTSDQETEKKWKN